MNDPIPMNGVNTAARTGSGRIWQRKTGGSFWKAFRLRTSALTVKAWALRRNSWRIGPASHWARFPNGREEALTRISHTSWNALNSFTCRWMR